jgi:anaerobic selenocysteine-containing dehydrogenase
MKVDSILTDKFTRRSFLQGGTAALAAAALYGCSTSPDSDESTGSPLGEYIVPQNDLNYGKGVEIKFNTGPYNCGSRCLHKFHIKNGRIIRMTSEGDIPRNGSAVKDESPGNARENPVQLRSCVRGYGYIQHNYQPNRLKYPLQQTGSKGNVETFKRIPWDTALDIIAGKIYGAAEKRSEYGYIPAISAEEEFVSSILPASDPNNFILTKNTDESTGSASCARFDTVGLNAFGNVRNDRFNTKFLICWALDPSRTTYFQVHALWIHTKLKEAGIPTVFITPNLNDSAAITGTGFEIDTSTIKTKYNGAVQFYYGASGGRLKVPRWIPCRPATDGALTTAIMYVLYKNELYDLQYLIDYTFGFFPNSSYSGGGSYNSVNLKTYYAPKTNNNNYANVTRTVADLRFRGGPPGVPLVFPDSSANTAIADVTTGSVSKGDKLGDSVTYQLPNDASFVEYLDSLETTWHTGGGTSQQIYDGVLEYAAAVTGVKPQYIEALAMKYAEPYLTNSGAAMVDVGGGANRAFNGTEWAWLQICLTAMCGYTDKEGGSCGFNMMSTPDGSVISQSAPGYTPNTINAALNSPVYGKRLAVNGVNILHIPVDGTDGRTAAQIVEDFKFQTGGADGLESELDITAFAAYDPTKPIRLDVFGSDRNIFNTGSNINKNRLGMLAIGFSYGFDNVMTPTNTYCDIVLPRATHFEEDNTCGNNNSVDGTSFYLMQNLCETPYETMRLAEFTGRLQAKIRQKFDPSQDGSYTPALPLSVEEVGALYNSIYLLSDVWLNKYGPDFKPGWEELKDNGKVDVSAPSNDPIIGFRDVPIVGDPVKKQVPANLYNSTGLINFFSPFWHIRMNMAVGMGTRGAEEDLTLLPRDNLSGGGRIPGVTEGPSGKFYGPGWRTATAKYIPVPGGYESMFDNLNPKTGNFVGYTSPLSGRTYKMLYMTNKSRNRAHTVFDSTAIIKDQYKQVAKINPITAAERGIRNGDMVYVYNDRGCMKIPAELTHQILPGCISIEHGSWYRAHPTETVTVWQKDRINNTYRLIPNIPVDVGGAENLLTDDDYTLDTPFNCQNLAAQTGPCEVSKVKPI